MKQRNKLDLNYDDFIIMHKAVTLLEEHKITFFGTHPKFNNVFKINNILMEIIYNIEYTNFGFLPLQCPSSFGLMSEFPENGLQVSIKKNKQITDNYEQITYDFIDDENNLIFRAGLNSIFIGEPQYKGFPCIENYFDTFNNNLSYNNYGELCQELPPEVTLMYLNVLKF